MKTIITSLFLLASVITFAQTKDFAIDLSESSVSIKPGESKQVTVSIVRSKYFAKEKATLGLQSALPQGITLTYEPKEGNFENSNALITVASDATPGYSSDRMGCLIIGSPVSRRRRRLATLVQIWG